MTWFRWLFVDSRDCEPTSAQTRARSESGNYRVFLPLEQEDAVFFEPIGGHGLVMESHFFRSRSLRGAGPSLPSRPGSRTGCLDFADDCVRVPADMRISR
jgi:hypothetical protein